MSDPRPPLAGVMGCPVAHSRSPRIFRHWFGEHGIAGDYVRLHVEPDGFEVAYRGLARAGFRGVNVTIPHKLAALRLADRASEAAQAIGAANMIRFFADGEIVSDNTDGYGFIESLRAGAPAWRPEAGPALVLGAGGAAMAVIHALRAAGVAEIRIANRSPDKAERLADRFGGAGVVGWADRSAAVDGAALIVNTTSLGMDGQPPLKIALDAAGPGTVVADIVYVPLETPLLASARARGLTGVDGLGMLLHQARPAFRAWFGPDPAVTAALRDAVLAP